MTSDKNEFGGVLLTNSVLLFFVLFPIWIAINTYWNQGIYSLTKLPTGQTCHMITLITMWLASMIYFKRMKYLYPLTRIVALMSILIFEIHLYDFIWSVQNWLFRGQPINKWALIFSAITTIIFIRLDSFHTIFRTIPLVLTFIQIVVIMLIGFVGMALTGFWAKMALVDSGILGIDPNQNVFWILSKIPSFLIVFPLIDDRDINAPLQLDSRVLTW